MIYHWDNLPWMRRNRIAMVDWVRQQHAARKLDFPLGDPDKPDKDFVEAYVNAKMMHRGKWAGRWIAKCECGGAEYVSFKSLVFMCCSCWNADHKHNWRRVELPKQRKAIEKTLEARPGKNQHYRVGESVDDLVRENMEHGVK